MRELLRLVKTAKRRERIDEIEAAREEVQRARERLDQAEDDLLVDAAIFEMTAAEMRLRHLLRLARQERGIA